MSLETILIIAGVVTIGGAILFFALARRAIRLAIRLTLALALILIVVVAAVVFHWYGTGKTHSPQNRPANTRRGNSR